MSSAVLAHMAEDHKDSALVFSSRAAATAHVIDTCKLIFTLHGAKEITADESREIRGVAIPFVAAKVAFGRALVRDRSTDTRVVRYQISETRRDALAEFDIVDADNECMCIPEVVHTVVHVLRTLRCTKLNLALGHAGLDMNDKVLKRVSNQPFLHAISALKGAGYFGSSAEPALTELCRVYCGLEAMGIAAEANVLFGPCHNAVTSGACVTITQTCGSSMVPSATSKLLAVIGYYDHEWKFTREDAIMRACGCMLLLHPIAGSLYSDCNVASPEKPRITVLVTSAGQDMHYERLRLSAQLWKR